MAAGEGPEEGPEEEGPEEEGPEEEEEDTFTPAEILRMRASTSPPAIDRRRRVVTDFRAVNMAAVAVVGAVVGAVAAVAAVAAAAVAVAVAAVAAVLIAPRPTVLYCTCCTSASYCNTVAQPG